MLLVFVFVKYDSFDNFRRVELCRRRQMDRPALIIDPVVVLPCTYLWWSELGSVLL